ncbi:MAG TPA: type IVB secretion system protein IcmV [Legionellaceae bacterium]|nr:type IVB secretion system protein IcmV [Legionellaceae bacterium]
MKNKTSSSSAEQSNSEKPSRTKRLLKWFFNPRAWSDWDRSKGIARFFLNMIERFFVIRKKTETNPETFENAMARFNLDEKALQAKALGLKRLSYSLLIVSLCLLLYVFYQLFYGSLRGVLISVVEVGIALVLAFRYHFWYFQIKQRKLGCTIQEWLNALRGSHS